MSKISDRKLQEITLLRDDMKVGMFLGGVCLFAQLLCLQTMTWSSLSSTSESLVGGSMRIGFPGLAAVAFFIGARYSRKKITRKISEIDD